ncbi:MAG TPA: glycerol-3-phosphate acyltransferase, partial [Eubacteriales bacterium]|nr:glycerol-3-phosphate acyltransferase [Eubacteriales bacterium]
MILRTFILAALISYLLGSINFAIIISHKALGIDIRDFGSGNAGSTNAYRTIGG